MNDDHTQQADSTRQFDTGEMPTVPQRGRSERRSRRRFATLAAALILLGAGTGAVLAASGNGDQTSATAAPAPAPADGSTVATVAPAPATDPVPSQDDAEPTPPPAAPGHLVVSTNHVNLGQNVFTGGFEVRNDGESPIDWAWDASHPAVSSAPSGGTLAPGESTVVEVTVHWQQLSNGGFMFQTHVTGGDQQLNVLVSGTKNVVVNPGVQLPDPQIKP